MRLVTKYGVFPRRDIKSISLFVSESISSEELSVDTLDAELRALRECGTVFQPKGAPALRCADGRLFTVRPLKIFLTARESDFQRGESVLLYDDNDALGGKFYMKSCQQVGDLFVVSCTSAVGLLDSAGRHYGGIFNGEFADEVIADIVGDLFPYTVDKRVRDIKVRNGYLPIGGRRVNLQRLLFAYGISVKRDENQDPYFTILSDEAPVYIPDSNIFLGGEVGSGESASQVRVTEHQYTALGSEAESTLFAGEVLADQVKAPSGTVYQGTLVEFAEPQHSLQVTGGEILESNANYAVLGPGSNLVLTGKPYTHTTRTVIRTKPGTVNAGENTVDFPDCTMICAVNADSVADRMMAFYGYAKIVTQDIKVNKQRPGDYVELSDPWKRDAKGFVQSMEFSFGQILRAATSIVTGYVRPGAANYENCVTLTGAGVYEVPPGVYRLRYTLVQGAQGGSAGHKGEPGGEQQSLSVSTLFEQDTGYWSGKPGKGGDGGKPGKAGKVYRGTLEVTPGQRIPYNCGLGGKGAAYDPANPDAPGKEGGHTTFGNISSALGEILPGGFLDLFSGNVYAATGADGIPGGDSAGRVEGDKPAESARLFVPAPSVIDEDGEEWLGGNTQRDTDLVHDDENTLKPCRVIDSKAGIEVESGYALGGGAAAGSAGLDGVEAGRAGITSYSVHTNPRQRAYAISADGLNGASAVKTPNKAPLTIGGRGGYGGGGGSPASYAVTIKYHYATDECVCQTRKGTPGQGGDGNDGGDGGDGIILINF